MISKEVVALIKQDLLMTEDHFNDIADRYKVSRASVNNINTGKSHKENILYPIRKLSNNYFSDDEVSFIRYLSKIGYSAKQIHIILTKGSYSTISNIISSKTRVEVGEYAGNKFLDERKYIFDIISTPHPNLVNTYTDTLTYEDAVYIKLLGRFMSNLIDTIEIFLPLIETEMIGFKHLLEDREDIETYLAWGGTTFNTIWWIKSIFNNKVNNLAGVPIHYDNFPIVLFKDIDPTINLIIVKDMINFETKENFKKSTDA